MSAARFKPRQKTAIQDGVYFRRKRINFISTGCTVLNCVVSGSNGGGWPLGRVVNIVGDKAVGKTLLAIEAAANFSRAYPKGKIWYREAEAAFDIDFAEALGLPVDHVDFGPDGSDTIWDTVEVIFDDLEKAIAECKKRKAPGLYIIDSLDALTSESELELGIRDGTYGTGKAKQLSQLFRRLVRDLKAANICLLVISQIRDKIGAQVRGDKYTRAGGKALDFYASLVVYLAQIEKLTKTIDGVKRYTGVMVKASCKKNKISVPFHSCTFPIRFMYGVDDAEASLDWLDSVKKLKASGFADIKKFTDEDEVRLKAAIPEWWATVEKSFAPERRKYA